MNDAAGLFSVFQRIYVINLEHRTDRRTEMEAQLSRIGLSFDHEKVTLFPASFPADQGRFPSRGARGCFESHLGVHEAILADGVERALVLEDDADLAPDFTRVFPPLLPQLKTSNWDILYSVTPTEPERPEDEIDAMLVRLRPRHSVQTSHFIGFGRACSEVAVSYLREMMERPGGHPEGGPMHVDGAYGWLRQAHPELKVVATRSPLAVQRSSRSDIAPLKFYDRIPGLRRVANNLRRMLP